MNLIRELVNFYHSRHQYPENRLEAEEVVRVKELAHENTTTGEPTAHARLYDVDTMHEDGVLAYGHLLSFHRKVGVLTIVRTIEPPDDVYYEYYKQEGQELKIEDLNSDQKEEIREIILHAFEGIPKEQLKLPSGHARRLVL